jgi:RNA polymerase sigma factor (sigma-70 family)
MEAPQTTRQVVETVLLDPHERHKLVVFAYARFGIIKQDAEDLLQDTALELLRQRHYVHSPQGYLFTVFRMRCVRFFRDRKASGVTVEIKETMLDAASHPAELEKSDKTLAVRQALCRISSVCRKLLASHYIEGKSLRETAADLARASSGVGNTISRCLKSLRACLN